MTLTRSGPDRTDELERRIGEIWSELLEDPDIPADSRFFDAGGDSMLLIVLLEQLRELTDREIEAADLFTHSTVRAQAAFLAGVDAVGPVPVPQSTDRRRLRERSVRVSASPTKDEA